MVLKKHTDECTERNDSASRETDHKEETQSWHCNYSEHNNFSRNLAITQRKCTNYSKALLKELGLSDVIPPYLIILHFHPGVSQDYIACHLNIDKGAVAKAIKIHVKNGYIDKKIDKNDKRKYNLFLTSKGEDTLPLIFDAKRKFEAAIASVLTQDELNSINHILNKITNELDF